MRLSLSNIVQLDADAEVQADAAWGKRSSGGLVHRQTTMLLRGSRTRDCFCSRQARERTSLPTDDSIARVDAGRGGQMRTFGDMRDRRRLRCSDLRLCRRVDGAHCESMTSPVAFVRLPSLSIAAQRDGAASL